MLQPGHDSGGSTSSESPKGKRETGPKNCTIRWNVYEYQEGGTKKVHMLVRPAEDVATASEISSAPIICLKEVEANNTFALDIMHHLRHKSILCMKGLCPSTTNNTHVTTFVEPTIGQLSSIPFGSCCDALYHFPSKTYQTAIRDIFDGIQFLWDNGLYHGNLNEENTLYIHPWKIKLSGFKCQDSMVTHEAQFGDRLSLANMLERLLVNVSQSNIYFCDHVADLISNLMSRDVPSSNILGTVFFWDRGMRTSFYTNNVSLKLKDAKFKLMIQHAEVNSLPWRLPWSPVSLEIKLLLTHMNAYRESNHMSKYDVASSLGFLMFICGAYTHRFDMNVSVDDVVRKNYPKLCLYLKKLVDTFDSSGFECKDRRCEKKCCKKA